MTLHRPPRLARYLLSKIIPDSYGDDVLDDMSRDYRKRVERRWSRWRADMWFWAQLFAPSTLRLAFLLRARERQHKQSTDMKLFFESLLQDVRYALRSLSRRPGWTAAISGTLALGLAATTAAFSILYGVMLKPLPFEDPDRLMALRRGDRWGWETVSFPVYEDLQRRQQVFQSVGVWTSSMRTMLLDNRPVRMRGAMINADLFPALGVHPVLGRLVAKEDDVEGASGVLVLSFSFWQNQFGGDQRVIGSSVSVNDRPYTVVGVMPEGFTFPTPNTQFWESLAFASRERQRFYLRPVARLKPGVSREAAQDHIRGTDWIIPPAGADPERVVPLQAMSLLAYSVRDSSKTLILFQGAAMAVLLIACLNVTSLLLVRAMTRVPETSLRAALGAGRARLARLTLSEAGMLGVIGGVIGIGAAYGLLKAALAAIPGGIPLQERITMGAPVVGSGMILAILAGVLIGLLPAVRTARSDLCRGIGNTGKGLPTGKSSSRSWSVLVSAQLALAVVLLVAGGLLLESFVKLRNVDPGFDAERVVVANVPISAVAYPDQQTMMAFYDELLVRLEASPQIRRATVVGQAPFTGWSDGGSQVESSSGVPEDVGYTEFQTVGPAYFETMGIPILTGRDFNGHDRTENASVAIVNETLSSRHFPESSALGKRVRLGDNEEDPWLTIVGVVGDIKHISLDRPPAPQIYLQYSLSSGPYRMPVVMNVAGDQAFAARAAREAVESIDPAIPAPSTYSLQKDMEGTVADERFNSLILGSFAATALLLAMLGVYSVVAHTVALRNREFGIRMALGATDRKVVGGVVKDSFLMIGSGLLLGLVSAFGMAGVIESFLFGVDAREPALFVVVAVALGAAALFATWVPATRAGRMDPVEAIRSE